MKKQPLEQFRLDIAKRADDYQKNNKLQETGRAFHNELTKAKYPYNFFWLGTPIIQTPTETQAFQEIIWDVKPDLIIETGIAWGGSIIFSASMITLLEACGEIKNGKVIGVDIDIREHNKKNILAHPMSKKITMFEGSSIDKEIVEKIKKIAKGKKRILVRLDSNHTHEHVLAELKAYAPLVSIGSYFVVDDTGIEDEDFSERKNDRPWGKGNNPKTAVWQFVKENKKFKIDKTFESKFVLIGSPDGFLRRIK
jgi:cephalosporin hydroxylase